MTEADFENKFVKTQKSPYHPTKTAKSASKSPSDGASAFSRWAKLLRRFDIRYKIFKKFSVRS